MRNIFETRDNFALCSNIKSRLLCGDVAKCPEPRVSILMPVYSHPKYFKIALQSAINQDYTEEYEIIVVDNNDDLQNTVFYDMVKDSNAPNVFYYKNEKNIGATGNWNRCIELARASFVTFCHDDDMLLPGALSRLMSLQKTAKGKAIFSAHNTIDETGSIINMRKRNIRNILKEKDHFEYTIFNQFISSAGFGIGCLFRKRCLLELGGYDNEFSPSFDYALHAHYTYRFGSLFNNIPTFNYRIADNTSFSVFERFVEVDKHFRECIRDALPYPKKLLNRIITANYNISKISFAISWGGKDKSLLASIRFSDRLIMRFIGLLLSIKRYTFIFL